MSTPVDSVAEFPVFLCETLCTLWFKQGSIRAPFHHPGSQNVKAFGPTPESAGKKKNFHNSGGAVFGQPCLIGQQMRSFAVCAEVEGMFCGLSGVFAGFVSQQQSAPPLQRKNAPHSR
jgi:hypothetical protein